MAAITRIRTIGGSLAITIPIELVRTQGLKEDEIVEIVLKKHKKNFFGSLKGIGRFTEKDRMEDRF
jgi:antitoxin component of MazEF toxin-antitoxin module